MLLEEESRISYLSSEKQDDGDIRCPNCSWYFSTNTKPYILPCFHNLCDKCINNLIQKNNAKCPICSKPFTHNETNPFQVNFTFLNIVTKILMNKIIFCKKCNQIYYWIDHYTSCNQENFTEVDMILNSIKSCCEQGFEILKIYNNNTNILIKFKNEINNLILKIIKDIRKNNRNKLKNELEKIFTVYGKEKNDFNFENIKNEIINFLISCVCNSEDFDKKYILNTISSYNKIHSNNKNKEVLNYSKNIKNGGRLVTQRCNKSPKISTLKTGKMQKDNNGSKNNYTHGNNSIVNSHHNRTILFLKTPTKEKSNFEIKTSINSYANSNKKIKQFELTKTRTNENSKKNISVKKNKNKSQNESEEEFIDYFDDDYHEVSTNENIKNTNKFILNEKNINNIKKDNNKFININNCTKKEKEKVNEIFLSPRKKFEETSQKNNKYISIKDVIDKSLMQDIKVEKKIIVGLNEIKVISLKKKINQTNINSNELWEKSRSEEINKYKNNKSKITKKFDKTIQEKNINFKKIFLSGKENINNKNFINSNLKSPKQTFIKNKQYNNNTQKGRKIKKYINNKYFDIENDKSMTEKKINSIPDFNELLSPNMKRSYDNIGILKRKVEKKNYHEVNNLIMSDNLDYVNSKKSFIKANGKKIKRERLKSSELKKKLIMNYSYNKTLNKKSFINNNKNNLENTNQNDMYFSNLLNNNKSMNKIFSHFNSIKDIITKIKRYENINKYISTNISDKINKNISLLKNNISQDYNLLLDNVTNNFYKNQRKYLFSFKNNTKSILLYNIEYNTFISLDLNEILTNFPLFNSSIQFEFVDNNNNNFLLFITGGKENTLKRNNKITYSSDSFIIINIKLDMIINYKEDINFRKKYVIEYKNKMPSGKLHHSILFHNNNLYIIGGFDDKNHASNECFYFSYKDKKWESLPCLNQPRSNCSICIYNKSILYAFRGRNEKEELDIIEYLNLEEKLNWKIINVVDYGFVWKGMYNSCTVVWEENKIVIFGGEDKNKLYKECFLFDIRSNQVYMGMDLKIPASFNTQGIYNNGKIYGFDFKNKNGEYEYKLHIFDIKNNYWSLIGNEEKNLTPFI